ncbi:spinster family MFS transporter [Polymorphobacter fuscus]|uniref:MFS transporter n=1 Tax=Sandarakinorhabdus fusca TaxID=1439888 RepID=A0A7C9KLW0_9SPHN|nr:MFS transporter [Polymorphobacter fuscus]KAB7648970.1 MFS transporter [Polymorphobacter fuscus]MQT16564.1 MFS transporter [Polymorphobacter fuscus]NJC07145.1 putative MFS family arabinose efflux permease [Polymorphobacter fuscus]
MASTPAGAARAVAPERVNSERLLLWTLLFVYIFNFLDRQIVTILAEPIKRDLGLSDTQLGLMTGLAFALFYAVLGIPIARYADRPMSNRVGLISFSLVLWSAMTAVCGLAQNFTQLLMARVGVGVGEAGCTPAAHSLISDAVPIERRASAIAFYGLGIPIGSLLGMVIGGFLADVLGWRRAFMVVGVPGLVLAAFVWFALRDPRFGSLAAALRARAPAPPRMPARAALADIFSSRAFVLVTLAGGFVAFLGYGKAVWAVIFFMRTHGLTPTQTGLWLGVVLGIAGLAGTWAGGWLADKFGRVHKRHMLTGPAVGMAVAAPMLFLGYSVDDWRVALALLVAPTFLNSLYYGPTYALAQQLVHPQARATATAVMMFAQNLIGLGLGPLAFGMMSDYFQPVAGAESVRWVLFGAAWLGLVPAVLFWRASLRLDQELTAKGVLT